MGRKLIDTVLTRKRLNLGMSQDKVAKLIGCNLSTYSAWETGKVMSAYADGKSADYIRRLADLYGTTIKQIEEAISNAYIKAKRNERTLDSLYEENDDDMNKVTDSKLRARREELGYTTFEVADTIGISKVTLKQWEVGYTKRPKNKSAVMSLAELYGWGVNETYMAIEEAYNTKYPWLAGNKSEVTEEVNDPFTAKYNDSMGGSGDDDNSSDEESIIEITQETEETVVEDKILCSDALAKILDACYDWTQKRQDYDDTRDLILNFMPPHETLEHLTIANTVNSIVDWFASKIYGACTYEMFTKLVDNIRMCLTKKADWDGDKED